MAQESGLMRDVRSFEEEGTVSIGQASSNDAAEGFSGEGTSWLRDLWYYRELLFFLAWRDFRLRYRQTFLGIAWALIQPFFMMVVFTLLFGKVVKVPSDGMPYPVFYYAGLLPWIYFSSGVGLSAVSVMSNVSLVTKVYFPRVFLPASPPLTGLVDIGISSMLLIGILVWYGVPFTWKLALWPGLVCLLFILTLSVGVLLAAFNVRYRDIKHALPLVMQLWLYATPIIYPLSLVPEQFRTLALLNPLTGIVEAFRASCSPTVSVDWSALVASVAVIGILFVVSLFYFTKMEREFADIA
jgi:homopolymeric O-antigen transport system permease protein